MNRRGLYLLLFPFLLTPRSAGAQELPPPRPIVPELPAPRPVGAPELPTWLPQYEVDMDCDLAGHSVKVAMRATWTNNHTVADDLR